MMFTGEQEGNIDLEQLDEQSLMGLCFSQTCICSQKQQIQNK